jgi:PAS domain S-box-containing protein
VDSVVAKFNFWQELGDSVPLAVIATDANGIVRLWSPGAVELYGWTAEETIGRPIQEITVGPVDLRVAQEIMESVICGVVWEGNFHARNRDGEVVEVHVIDLPIVDDDKQTVGIVGLSFEVVKSQDDDSVETLLRLAYQLRESRLLERMRIARVLHDEIGQTLAMARSESLAIAKDGVSTSLTNMTEHLDIAITRLRQLVENLLESRIDVWEMILRCYELTRELQSRIGVLARCQILGSVSNYQRIEPDIAFIVYSVLRESLRNVERHASAQLVDVTVKSDKGFVTITVTDDGEGMHGANYGMGLTILHDSVRQLKGEFEVRPFNDAGLTGTIVSARIPLVMSKLSTGMSST